MDVNATHKAWPPFFYGCFYYRNANHVVRYCPQRLNIRMLLVEQYEEIIEDFLILQNMQEAEAQEEKGFVKDDQ